MITPSFALTATERILPRMALDFTTATLDSRVTFTRTGNTATVTNSSGVIAAINANLPRFDFDPTTLVCKGLLIEEARTNALLNSLIDGTSLATQLVTVTAAARTLSFYGTGSVVLSGAHSATVVGAGVYPTRTTLSFTPSAGVLTLTVTGTVQYAQLEVGAFATSFIPTAAATVTRNADVATMTGANFSDWYNQTQGTFVATFDKYVTNTVGALWWADDGSSANVIDMVAHSIAKLVFEGITTSVYGGNITSGTLIANTKMTGVSAYSSTTTEKASLNGVAATAGSLTLPSSGLTRAVLGSQGNSLAYLNGHLYKMSYYPQALTAAEVQAFSK